MRGFHNIISRKVPKEHSRAAKAPSPLSSLSSLACFILSSVQFTKFMASTITLPQLSCLLLQGLVLGPLSLVILPDVSSRMRQNTLDYDRVLVESSILERGQKDKQGLMDLLKLGLILVILRNRS